MTFEEPSNRQTLERLMAKCILLPWKTNVEFESGDNTSDVWSRTHNLSNDSLLIGRQMIRTKSHNLWSSSTVILIWFTCGLDEMVLSLLSKAKKEENVL